MHVFHIVVIPVGHHKELVHEEDIISMEIRLHGLYNNTEYSELTTTTKSPYQDYG